MHEPDEIEVQVRVKVNVKVTVRVRFQLHYLTRVWIFTVDANG